MNPNDWQRVRELFSQALDQPAHERNLFLACHCGADTELKREVVSLLAAHDQAERLLGTVVEPAGEAEPDGLVGRRLGAYRVVSLLGRGGMGAVYLARRDDAEFEKRVALKVLQPDLGSGELVRRFRRERQILAALDHPYIAKLLDGGSTEDGLPYLVMEHVQGRPIDCYCREQGLEVSARLELFRRVLAAIQFAHQNLVVHRDLKPGNILVTADGTPKLLDFGIAKLLNPELVGESTPPTLAQVQPLTPDYASPEQLAGGHVTTASDVYSLGVLLYELLAGRRPERGRDNEPLPPSQVAGKRLGRDLDTIVLAALAQVPARRYGSVEQLSEDLRRVLEGLPIAARRGSWIYRAGKFVRRHRLAVGLATATALALSSFACGMALLASRLGTERDRAERERLRAEKVTEFLVEVFRVSDPLQGSGTTLTAREILEHGTARLESDLRDQPEIRGRLFATLGAIYGRLGLYERAEPLLTSAWNTLSTIYGENDSRLIDLLSEQATVDQERGQLDSAAARLERVLALTVQRFGGDHESVARAIYRRGVVERLRGQVAAAEASMEKSLALRRRLGSGPVAMAESLQGLSSVLWERGRYPEAEALAREALALRRQGLGNHHLETAASWNLLAVSLAGLDRMEEAEAAMQQALEIRRGLLPADHPKVAESLNNLGALLRDRGQPERAEPLFEEALKMRRRTFGERHPTVASTLENLASLAALRQDFALALERYQQSLAIRRNTLGEKHRLVSDSLFGVASALAGLERIEEAEVVLRQCLELRRELLGPEHPRVVHTVEQLARLERRAAPERAIEIARFEKRP